MGPEFLCTSACESTFWPSEQMHNLVISIMFIEWCPANSTGFRNGLGPNTALPVPSISAVNVPAMILLSVLSRFRSSRKDHSAQLQSISSWSSNQGMVDYAWSHTWIAGRSQEARRRLLLQDNQKPVLGFCIQRNVCTVPFPIIFPCQQSSRGLLLASCKQQDSAYFTSI